MNRAEIATQALEQMKTLLSGVGGTEEFPAALRKAFTQATGLVWYDLQPAAKLLYPVDTPLRNMIPRVPADGGTATHWKAITGVNIGLVDPFVSEGNRGGVISTQEKDYLASYKTLGLEDYVTIQADLAAKNFDDVKALAVLGLLNSLMMMEERAILWGNASLQLGTTPTPTLTQYSSGGSLGAGTFSVICVALTYFGYMRASVSSTGVVASISRSSAGPYSNTDTVAGGAAIQSANATTTFTSGSANVIGASVTPVPGAVAYAWYLGAVGSEKIVAITTINSVLLTATPAPANQAASALPSTDYSYSSLNYDGLVSLINQSGSGSLVTAQATGNPGAGAPLTSDGAGGIKEIDAMFKALFDQYRLRPELIIASSQEVKNINAKVIAGGGAPIFRFVVDTEAQKGVPELTLTAGTVVGNYLNKYTMEGGHLAKIMLHPYMPPGTMLFYSQKIPYKLSNVANPINVKCRRDYWQFEWPFITLKYEYGVYMDGCLEVYFPPAYGMLYNIADG